MKAPHTELARAKINLALHVLGRRADLYHELDSLVAFADAADRLTFEPAARTELAIGGPFAGAVPADESNLVLKAVRLMEKAFPGRIPSLRVSLEKNLPVAAGIGGGSADAAATLRAVARLAGLDAQDEALQSLALSLGADVPVCLVSRASRMKGIGAEVERLADFAPLPAMLVNPGLAVRTPEIFAALALAPGDCAFTPIPTKWDIASLRNDLTAPAIRVAPEIAPVLADLQGRPQVQLARMSGSGATCFALCATAEKAQNLAEEIARDHPDWWIAATMLR
ncbi:MAG: 4-(cytidine 5'-diphospho)-2-C-methyl-D-erythritol kinase [Parvibaculaceae bacterium]